MKPNDRFVNQSKEFWAYVRTISQQLGYTKRADKTILVPDHAKVKRAFEELDLSVSAIENKDRTLTPFGEDLYAYFSYRSDILYNTVRNNLMKKADAEHLFQTVHARLNPKCPLPYNKQKGDKRNYAFLTGIVNMLIESSIGDEKCDYDPRSLTTITFEGKPLRTLSRRVDGAFPSVINPVAIWEIKEYYYTTTFGSRVADGVYETLLDGMELAELQSAGHQKVKHILIVDDHFTWWECGRSYLCRLIDMLHMGYVDEVIFGREVVARIPELATEWKAQLRLRGF